MKTYGLSAPPNMTYHEIPNGLGGTAATVETMKSLAIAGSRNPSIISLARAIVEDVPQQDFVGEARALFDWVQDNVRYVRDPLGMELVADPAITLFVSGQGDCDDQATVLAALALALSLEAGFRTVSADRSRPNDASHIYALIGVRKNGSVTWYAADSTQPEATLGWEPPGVWNPKDWLFR